MSIVLCISKIDRLVLELKLPPQDAYLKIKLLLEEVNTLLQEYQLLYPLCHKQPLLSPSSHKPNVFFSAAKYNIIFSLATFASKYNSLHQTKQFTCKHFWGDLYYHPTTNKFKRTGEERTFVHFILSPLYKVFSAAVGETAAELSKLLGQLDIYLKKKELRQDT
jgi:U5 small nuclear ribonucleoprotein component